MSFFDDLGNWLHKTTDDAVNTVFGNHSASPQPQAQAQPQGPAPIHIQQPQQPQLPSSMQVHTVSNTPQPTISMTGQPTTHPQLLDVMSSAPIKQPTLPNQSSISISQPSSPQYGGSLQTPLNKPFNSGSPLPVTTAQQVPNVQAPAPIADDFTKAPTIYTRAKTLQQGINNNLSMDQLSNNTGLTTDEIAKYTDLYHPGYGAKSPVEATANFLGDSLHAAAGLVQKPITSLMTAVDPTTTKAINDSLNSLNDAYHSGAISQAKLTEQVNSLLGDQIGHGVTVDQDGVHQGGEQEAVKQSLLGGLQQGVDTGSVIPAGNAFKVPEVAISTAGDLVKSLLARNAAQAGVYGTTSTANDVIQGRGVTPESLAMNYAAPFVLGSAAELGGVGGRKLINITRDAQVGPGSQTGSIQLPGSFNPSEEASKYSSLHDYLDNVQGTPNKDVADLLQERDASIQRQATQPEPQDPRGRLQLTDVRGKQAGVYVKRGDGTSPQTSRPAVDATPSALSSHELSPQYVDQSQLGDQSIGLAHPVRKSIQIDSSPSDVPLNTELLPKEITKIELKRLQEQKNQKQIQIQKAPSSDGFDVNGKVSLPNGSNSLQVIKRERSQQKIEIGQPVHSESSAKNLEKSQTYSNNTITLDKTQLKHTYGDNTPIVLPKDKLSIYDAMNFDKNKVVPPKIKAFKDAEDTAIPLLKKGLYGDAIKVYANTAEVPIKEAGNNMYKIAQHFGIKIPEDTNISPGYEPSNNPLYHSIKQLFRVDSKNEHDAAMKAQAASDIQTKNFHDALMEGHKLNPYDREFLRDIETHPVDKLAAQAQDPKQFIKTANAMRDYYNTRHALGNLAEQPTAYLPEYTPHHYRLDTPEDEKAFEAYKALLSRNPSYTKGRTFDSYDKAAAYDLHPRYETALHDMIHDYNKSNASIRGNILADELDKAFPGKLSIGELPVDEDGSVYKQLKLFGNQGAKLSMPKDIADKVNRMAFPEHEKATGAIDKTIAALGKSYDLVNRSSKQVLLGGGLFHAVNTGLFAITKPLALIRHMIHSAGEVSPEQDSIRKLAGLTTMNEDLQADYRSGDKKVSRDAAYDAAINKVLENPSVLNKGIAISKKVINVTHTLTFEKGIKNFKEGIFDDVTKGLDPGNTNDLHEMRRVAATLNDFYGGINRLMSGTVSPKVFKMLTRTILAPDFLEGQVRGTGRAFAGAGKIFIGKSDRADRLAAQMLFGRIITVGAGVTAYNAIAHPRKNKDGSDESGMQIFQDFLQNMLTPEVRDGRTSANGTPQTVALPSTFLNVIAHSVTPLFNGDPDKLSGVKHEVSARTAAGLRGITSLATNQDYYGNPIITPGNNKQTLINLASQFGPIPISSAISSTKGGTQPVDLTKTAISVLGGREHNDPTSDQSKATNQYYSITKQATSTLGTDDLNAWNALHPASKDGSGNYINTPSIWDKDFNATDYLAHPNVLKADSDINTKLAADGQKVDPFWTDLTTDQQQKLLQSRTMIEGGADKTKFNQENASWLPSFQAKQASFYNSLPPSDPLKPTLSLQPPTQTDAIKAKFGVFDSLDPSLQGQFIKNNPDLADYLDKSAQYNNQVRVAKGYDALRTAPVAAPTTQTFMDTYFAADKPTRTAMRNSNPDAYLGMQNYFANADRYSLDKAASLDQLVSPGTDQNAAPSQKYEKSAFNLGQYDIAKGTDANGKTAFQWLPSTNSADGSTANVSPVTKITQGGPGFKGIDGYSGSGSGSSSHKKQKKQRIKRSHVKIRSHKPHIDKAIRINPPKAKIGRIALTKAKKVTPIKLV